MEFKAKVIETLRGKGLNHSKAGQRFEIEFHTLLQIRERLYLVEGSEGFLVERRPHSAPAHRLKTQLRSGKGTSGSSPDIRNEKQISKNWRFWFQKVSHASTQSAGIPQEISLKC